MRSWTDKLKWLYRPAKKLVMGVLALLIVLFMSLSVSGCAGSSTLAEGTKDRTELVVFAAASLTESFEAIKEVYESEHPEVKIVYNFAGSQVLTNQIRSGAAPGMFFSANEKYVDELIVAGIDPFNENLTPQKVNFAVNELVIVTGNQLISSSEDEDQKAEEGYKDFDEDFKDFEALMTLLTSQEDYPVVIANEDVPVGRYTKKMMSVYLEFTDDRVGYDSFYDQVVSYESDVKAVLTKVKIHEADISVVYRTDAMSVEMEAQRLKTIEIPADFNQQASYGSVLFTEEEAVKAFYEYVVYGEGKEILQEFGFN